MNDGEPQSGQRLSFELRNVGSGGETVRAAALAADSDDALLVLLASHYCPTSRSLVRTLCDRHGAFRSRGIDVVPILPDIRERGRVWDERYDLPFPLLVDPATDEAETFGTVDALRRALPGLPGLALVSRIDGDPTVVATTATVEDPSVDGVLEWVDAHRDDGDTT